MIPRRLRVLICASQPVAAFLAGALQREGHAVVRTSPANGLSTVADSAERYRVNAVLVEISTVTQSELWNNIVEKLIRSRIAVIALTSEEEIQRLERLNLDDFVVFYPDSSPPCNPHEVEWRIYLALREYEGEEEIIRIGDVEIIPSRYEVLVKGRPIVLTLKEYELLKFLATHPGRVFTRKFLLSEIWGYDHYGGTRTVDVHIGRIRSKLDVENPIIRTVRGVGYMLEETKKP
jgi:DNA-binding response OmpR family regulator